MSLSKHTPQNKRSITSRKQLIGFGRYAKETVQDVLDNHPEYFMWLDEKTDIEIASDILAEADKNAHPVHTFSGWTER